MKFIFLVITFLSLVACSHHHNKIEHHHHPFNKKCAYEVSQNHLNVEGKEEFSILHDKETYYFSSAEKMQKFQSDINANISRSKENWKKGPPSSRGR